MRRGSEKDGAEIRIWPQGLLERGHMRHLVSEPTSGQCIVRITVIRKGYLENKTQYRLLLLIDRCCESRAVTTVNCCIQAH